MYEIRAVTLGIEVGVWGSTVGRGSVIAPIANAFFYSITRASNIPSTVLISRCSNIEIPRRAGEIPGRAGGKESC